MPKEPANPDRAVSRAPATVTDRVPPQDLDAEMALIGSMMMSRDAIAEVVPIIGRQNSRWLYRPDHQKLFEVLLDLYDDPHKAVDLIMVSDEVDQSPGPPDFYVDFFKNIKGFRNDQLMDVSVVVGDVPNGCSYGGIYADAAPRYKYVQEATGGIFRSHCSANWGSTLSDLGLDTFAARTQFPLTRSAAPGTIVVTVDAHDGNGPQSVPEDIDGSGDGWEYDGSSNSIVFGDDAVPPRGATITVSYETTCL